MIKIIPKIMNLMELFASGDEISFSEIREQTGLTKSNVSHLLSALCENGILVRTGYGRYRRGERLIRLCNGDNLWRELCIMAERCADNMVGWFNELTVVGLRFQGHRLTLVKRKPIKNLQVEHESERHYQADWYGTANGRILLAFAPGKIVSDVVRHCGLPSRKNWSAAVTLPKLMRELKQIRDQGYVMMKVDDDIKAIGVPARDASGEAVLSIATAFPVFSCRKTDAEIVERLKYESDSFGKEMAIKGITVTELNLNATCQSN